MGEEQKDCAVKRIVDASINAILTVYNKEESQLTDVEKEKLAKDLNASCMDFTRLSDVKFNITRDGATKATDLQDKIKPYAAELSDSKNETRIKAVDAIYSDLGMDKNEAKFLKHFLNQTHLQALGSAHRMYFSIKMNKELDKDFRNGGRGIPTIQIGECERKLTITKTDTAKGEGTSFDIKVSGDTTLTDTISNESLPNMVPFELNLNVKIDKDGKAEVSYVGHTISSEKLTTTMSELLEEVEKIDKDSEQLRVIQDEILDKKALKPKNILSILFTLLTTGKSVAKITKQALKEVQEKLDKLSDIKNTVKDKIIMLAPFIEWTKDLMDVELSPESQERIDSYIDHVKLEQHELIYGFDKSVDVAINAHINDINPSQNIDVSSLGPDDIHSGLEHLLIDGKPDTALVFNDAHFSLSDEDERKTIEQIPRLHSTKELEKRLEKSSDSSRSI